MHTIEKKKKRSFLTQLRSWERRKLHFRESNFTNFPRGACPRTPLGVRASGANGARPPAEPLHPVLPNATENPDFIKHALPVSRLHNKIFRENTLMLKYIYILRKFTL